MWGGSEALLCAPQRCARGPRRLHSPHRAEAAGTAVGSPAFLPHVAPHQHPWGAPHSPLPTQPLSCGCCRALLPSPGAVHPMAPPKPVGRRPSLPLAPLGPCEALAGEGGANPAATGVTPMLPWTGIWGGRAGPGTPFPGAEHPRTVPRCRGHDRARGCPAPRRGSGAPGDRGCEAGSGSSERGETPRPGGLRPRGGGPGHAVRAPSRDGSRAPRREGRWSTTGTGTGAAHPAAPPPATPHPGGTGGAAAPPGGPGVALHSAVPPRLRRGVSGRPQPHHRAGNGPVWPPRGYPRAATPRVV